MGEVEVVFGLWAVVLVAAIAVRFGWGTATHYVNDTVDYTEPLFVVVIMALASTRPIVALAERALRRVAQLGGNTPAAWWLAILTLGAAARIVHHRAGGDDDRGAAARPPVLRSQARDRALKYATLGLLFVNVSIGGTLTHFAAPPVLMVARHWGWDTPSCSAHFGWRAALAIVASNLAYFLIFRRELRPWRARPPSPDVDRGEEDIDGVAHRAAVADPGVGHRGAPPASWPGPSLTAHYPALFLGGFLFFLGFARATAAHQSRIDLRAPLLVGFFLGGLVIHGGLQAWWIAPVLSSLSEVPPVLRRHGPHRLQRQRADHLPRDAGAQPRRAAENRRRRGRGDRRRPHRHRQRAESRGPGAAQPVFRRRDLPARLFAGALLPTLIAILAFRML